MESAKIWVGGEWRAAEAASTFEARMPASITRFTALQCCDYVREERLPAFLRG